MVPRSPAPQDTSTRILQRRREMCGLITQGLRPRAQAGRLLSAAGAECELLSATIHFARVPARLSMRTLTGAVIHSYWAWLTDWSR